jgi:acetylornithine deacetylase/succinyl-diaminopimelate desuccinylase-like protein
MADAVRDSLGIEPKVSKMVAWTDSCWLHVLANTPVVVFGPANSDTVHGPNENVAVDDLIFSAKALSLYLYRALRAGEPA